MDHRSVWEFLHAEGLSHKKTAAAQEQDRNDVKRRREQWREYQGSIDSKRLIFIDETWTKTNMASLRGWGPRGSRVIGKAPFGVGRPRPSSRRCATMGSQPLVLRWSDRRRGVSLFLAWVQEILVPVLKPGEIVILDNLGSHRGKAVRRPIQDAQAEPGQLGSGKYRCLPSCLQN